MKKFGKFIFASLSVAAFAGGAYYLVKNIINKDSNDEFDEFEDDFDDFDLDEDTDCESCKEERGYVTLSFQEENNSDEEAKSEDESQDSDVQDETMDSETETDKAMDSESDKTSNNETSVE